MPGGRFTSPASRITTSAAKEGPDRQSRTHPEEGTEAGLARLRPMSVEIGNSRFRGPAAVLRDASFAGSSELLQDVRELLILPFL